VPVFLPFDLGNPKYRSAACSVRGLLLSTLPFTRRRYSIFRPQPHLSFSGKSLNALTVWVHFHGSGSGSILFRDRNR
jgi:hypothetical protein